LLLFLVCLSSLTAYSQDYSHAKQNNMDNNSNEAFAVVQQLAKLLITRDTTELNKILDKDFTLTHMTGYLQPKEEWLHEIAKETMKYYSKREVNHTIKINGNFAEVMIQSMVDARIWGSRNTWRLQQKMKLEKRNGSWIILSSVASTF